MEPGTQSGRDLLDRAAPVGWRWDPSHGRPSLPQARSHPLRSRPAAWRRRLVQRARHPSPAPAPSCGVLLGVVSLVVFPPRPSPGRLRDGPPPESRFPLRCSSAEGATTRAVARGSPVRAHSRDRVGDPVGPMGGTPCRPGEVGLAKQRLLVLVHLVSPGGTRAYRRWFRQLKRDPIAGFAAPDRHVGGRRGTGSRRGTGVGATSAVDRRRASAPAPICGSSRRGAGAPCGRRRRPTARRRHQDRLRPPRNRQGEGSAWSHAALLPQAEHARGAKCAPSCSQACFWAPGGAVPP